MIFASQKAFQALSEPARIRKKRWAGKDNGHLSQKKGQIFKIEVAHGAFLQGIFPYLTILSALSHPQTQVKSGLDDLLVHVSQIHAGRGSNIKSCLRQEQLSITSCSEGQVIFSQTFFAKPGGPSIIVIHHSSHTHNFSLLFCKVVAEAWEGKELYFPESSSDGAREFNCKRQWRALCHWKYRII